MSFDEGLLRRLREEVEVPLVQLVDSDRRLRRRDLKRVARYATAVGLHKDLILPRDGRGRSRATVRKALDAGLDVLVWTLRKGTRAQTRELLDLGVDGVLTDFPEVAVEVRSRWAEERPVAL
jgi:glycerophosphoryl diester phosphodiesterase